MAAAPVRRAPTLSVRVAERLSRAAGSTPRPPRGTPGARRAAPGPSSSPSPRAAASGRPRWYFDVADRTVTATDDEARWLSEEEEPAPAPPRAAPRPGPGRTTTVYDVEAEGGLRAAARPAAATVEPTDAERPVRAERDPEPLDLMTAMRERSTARGRRKSGARRGPRKSPTNVPGAGEHVPDDAVPLEDMAYDPETMPPPPAAHAHPDLPDPLDARPEPQAAAWAEAAGLALDDVAPAPHGGDDAAADADEPEVTAVAITAAETETAEVLESVQSLESPHRTDEPVATPADTEDDTEPRTDAEDDASGVAPQDAAVERRPEGRRATVAPSPAQDPAPEAGRRRRAAGAASRWLEQPVASSQWRSSQWRRSAPLRSPRPWTRKPRSPRPRRPPSEPAPRPVPPAAPRPVATAARACRAGTTSCSAPVPAAVPSPTRTSDVHVARRTSRRTARGHSPHPRRRRSALRTYHRGPARGLVVPHVVTPPVRGRNGCGSQIFCASGVSPRAGDWLSLRG